jgi:hypothetical protein
VASAKRGVLGGLREDDVEDESVEAVRTGRAGVRSSARVRFFSSVIAMVPTMLPSPISLCCSRYEWKEETSLRYQIKISKWHSIVAAELRSKNRTHLDEHLGEAKRNQDEYEKNAEASW